MRIPAYKLSLRIYRSTRVYVCMLISVVITLMIINIYIAMHNH